MIENEQKIKFLLERLLAGDLPEHQQDELFEQISTLSPDPYWSDLVFWSNDFVNADDSFNYTKFFQKIAEYPTSEHGKKRAEIQQLLADLLSKNFSKNSEMAIINRLNTLIGNSHWIDDIFVKNNFRNADGSLNYDDFFDQILPQPHEIQQFFK